jgi:uncharacterized repeat protein (TIGR01451 family)
MFTLKLLKRVGASAALAIALGGAQDAHAIGTQAGTTVDNQAVVDYQVGGVDQPDIPSSPTGNSSPTGGAPTQFLVDRLVDVTVAAVPGAAPGYIDVAPGSTGQVLAFDVTNTSNDILDFELGHVLQSGLADPFGGTDSQDATLVGVFVDDGDNSYDPVLDTATFIDELSATAGSNTVRVFVVADFPLPGPGWADGDVSAHILTATGREGNDGTTGGPIGAALTADPGPEDPAAEETVFGDAAVAPDIARNADHSDTHAFRVRTATLTVTKTSTVISDPVNAVAPFYAIPGAVIEYEVTIANTGSDTASSVTVSDDLSTMLDAATGSVDFNDGAYGAPGVDDIELEHSVSGTVTFTRGVGDDDGEIDASDVLTVSNVTLGPTESATVRFQVVVR